MNKAKGREGKAKSNWQTALIALSSAIIGALAATYAQSGHLYLIPAGSYQDLAAILLGAVGVIVAIFGGVLAIAAFWGFAQMKHEAVTGATAAALDELKEHIENGPLRDYILGDIERMIKAEVESARMDRRIQERVDKIALGTSEDRLLEDGSEEDEK